MIFSDGLNKLFPYKVNQKYDEMYLCDLVLNLLFITYICFNEMANAFTSRKDNKINLLVLISVNIYFSFHLLQSPTWHLFSLLKFRWKPRSAFTPCLKRHAVIRLNHKTCPELNITSLGRILTENSSHCYGQKNRLWKCNEFLQHVFFTMHFCITGSVK